MSRLTLCLLSILLSASLSSMTFAGDVVHPIKMSKEQIAGTLFEDYEPIVHDYNGNVTHDVEIFLSPEKEFDAGMYKSGKVRAEINEPYGVHEYMHFIEGGVTLTSSDGTITEIKAGDSVVIPADFTGVWDTEGYTKIYVIYNPDGPIE